MTITLTNTDPEARIEQLVHELAYERVHNSYLWNSSSLKTNGAIDAKAEELAGLITGLVEEWLAEEVGKVTKLESERIGE